MPGLKIAHFGLPRQYSELREEILDVTDRVLATGCVMDGHYTKQFESWLAQRNGRDYAVACHSGTQALEIIARFYRERHAVIQKPRVVIPALTYPATANAWITAGWDIIFADVDRWGVIDKVPEISEWDAICMVGLYGHSISERFFRGSWHEGWNQRLIIEDAAQHWLSNCCRRVGVASAISFDPTKNFGSYGNGGAIVTSDPDVAKFARDWTRNGRASNHGNVGSNSRMSEVDCAQLMVKTYHLDRWQQRRADIARYYITQFQSLPIHCLIQRDNFADHCYQKFVIEVENRDQLKSRLAFDGIDTRIHYERSLHELDAFSAYRCLPSLTKAIALSRRVLTLPLYPELTDSEVEFIADRVRAHVL